MFLDGIFRLHDYCLKHFEKKPNVLKDEGSLVQSQHREFRVAYVLHKLFLRERR